jgi:transcriptional regulator with XRE-family HTH domain
MIVGDRWLRALRQHYHLSQGDIERRTSLLRCYLPRVEYRHIVPAVETLMIGNSYCTTCATSPL